MCVCMYVCACAHVFGLLVLYFCSLSVHFLLLLFICLYYLPVCFLRDRRHGGRHKGQKERQGSGEDLGEDGGGETMNKLHENNFIFNYKCLDVPY